MALLIVEQVRKFVRETAAFGSAACPPVPDASLGRALSLSSTVHGRGLVITATIAHRRIMGNRTIDRARQVLCICEQSAPG